MEFEPVFSMTYECANASLLGKMTNNLHSNMLKIKRIYNDFEIRDGENQSLLHIFVDSKYEEEFNLDNFSLVNFNNIIDAYCNDDWYMLVYNDGTIEKHINSYDMSCEEEISKINNFSGKILIKNRAC